MVDNITRAMGTCKHFNGVLGSREGATCRAGVNYREHVGGEDIGWVLGLPCTLRYPSKMIREVIPCALRELPSKEEVEKEEAETENWIKLTIQAMKLCREDARNQRGVIRTVKCPACGGDLRYSVSSYNGHLQGKCKTKGCLEWIE